MDALRYGWLHIILIGGAASALVFLALTVFNISLNPTVFVSAGVFIAGVLALDILVTPSRILNDFQQGRFSASARGSRFLLALTLSKAKKAGLKLNMATCFLAVGDYETGGSFLRETNRKNLKEDLSALWENNYAYFLMGVDGSPEEALNICDGTVATGFRNPFFHRTRGIALSKLGRLDDAIAEFCRSMEAGQPGPADLAETYYHLGSVWNRKGENAYARDHFLKAVNVAPESRYGKKAAETLNHSLQL